MADINEVPQELLELALENHARGTLNNEAALILLMETDMAKSRQFRAFIDYSDDPEIVGNDGPIASVRWKDFVAALDGRKLRIHDTHEKLMRLAASLGGGVPVDLRENFNNSLGRVHKKYALAALAHMIEVPVVQ
jgi:hypothetical protein